MGKTDDMRMCPLDFRLHYNVIYLFFNWSKHQSPMFKTFFKGLQKTNQWWKMLFFILWTSCVHKKIIKLNGLINLLQPSATFWNIYTVFCNNAPEIFSLQLLNTVNLKAVANQPPFSLELFYFLIFENISFIWLNFYTCITTLLFICKNWGNFQLRPHQGVKSFVQN